jgi:hypothetical protein
MRCENFSLIGGLINIPIPLPEQVKIEDIAHRLSNICRFNGAVREFFSVGQHSLEVATLCRLYAHNYKLNPYEAELAGLLHDAPEYAYGDLITPVKKTIGDDYMKLTIPADTAIFKGLGVTDIMKRCHDAVVWADFEMLLSDAARWDVFGGDYISLNGEKIYIEKHNVVPFPHQLFFANNVPMKPGEAKQPFLNRYHELINILGL